MCLKEHSIILIHYNDGKYGPTFKYFSNKHSHIIWSSLLHYLAKVEYKDPQRSVVVLQLISHIS